MSEVEPPELPSPPQQLDGKKSKFSRIKWLLVLIGLSVILFVAGTVLAFQGQYELATFLLIGSFALLVFGRLTWRLVGLFKAGPKKKPHRLHPLTNGKRRRNEYG